MSCMKYFHNFLLQKSFITHYLFNTIGRYDGKLLSFSNLKNKNFYKYFSATHIYIPHRRTVMLGVTYIWVTSHGTC